MTKQEFFKAHRVEAMIQATNNFDTLDDFTTGSPRFKNLNADEKLEEFTEMCLESWFDDWLISRA